MSRIGKKPIKIPSGVEVKIEYKEPQIQKITAKGQKGELSLNVCRELRAEIKEGEIFVYPHIQAKNTNAMWGLTRTLISNIITGVTEGYEKKLEIEGVGYNAQVKEDELELKVGYINTLKVKAPKGITFSVDKHLITVSGIDKELVGQIAAKIKKQKPAEPYKGKGIKYLGEIIRRKSASG
jgi:large subunit ribosomal protein L6